MIKKSINYTDLEGNAAVEEAYFNLNKLELLELNMGVEGGIDGMLNRVSESNKPSAIFDFIKTFVLKAYGIKSADGKRLDKVVNGKPIADDFAQSEAFAELLVSLLSDENEMNAFMLGVLPASMASEVQKIREQN